MITDIELTHFSLFSGLGGGSKGMNRSRKITGNYRTRWRCLGGVDNNPAAILDFNRMTNSKGTVLDMFSREQYLAWHGHEPPADWREALPIDIWLAAGGEFPNAVILSAPCKGFSGLLAEKTSKTDKYQALNQLTLRGIWLSLEAFKDDPPEFYAFENVPRIMTRGRPLLDQIVKLFRAYGYEVAETTHDCGVLGGLHQSRKRFLMMARYVKKVPNFLYVPQQRSLRPVGELLTRMPVPGAYIGDMPVGGAMHRVPALQWKTWVRLAFVTPGRDWRSLNDLNVVDGKLADYLIVPDNRNNGFLGVQDWNETSGTIAGRSMPHNGNFSVGDPRVDGQRHGPYGVNAWDQHTRTIAGQTFPTNGNFSVADPRFAQSAKWSDGQAYGVLKFDEPTGTIAGKNNPGQGAYTVADPRHHGPAKHSNEFRVIRMDQTANAVTSAHGTGQAIADPRPDWENRYNNLHVGKWDKHAGTVIAGGKGVQGGWPSVADPRILHRGKGDHYLTGGHYGVISMNQHSYAVSGHASHDNGWWNVADTRMPEATDNLVCFIRSIHDTWNRPFTTLELAALQSLIEPEEHLELEGLSDSAWRERIGNAIPPHAFEAVGDVMAEAIIGARSGQTFTLSNTDIWVRNAKIAISTQQGDIA